MRIIEEELDKPLEQVFSYISERPVAAASLGRGGNSSQQMFNGGAAGQVYRAKLRGSGVEVAIKVQRPGIEPIIFTSCHITKDLYPPTLFLCSQGSVSLPSTGAAFRQDLTGTIGMQRSIDRRRIR